MERFERAARIVAYLAIIALCCLYVYERFRSPTSIAIPRAEQLIGESVKLPLPSTSAIVFSLSTTCPYCKASAPFYQRLVNDVLPKMRKGIATVAFFPQAISDAEDYVGHTLGVTFDSIQTGAPLGISAIPTLMLVDESGKVVKAWIGQLAASGEEEVIRAISELR